MRRKGQAAMEFLMTYGWAILVVLAAIGALAYFGVLSPSKFLPDRCQFASGFDCIGKAKVVAAGVTFTVVNNQGAGVELTNITGLSCVGTGTACNITNIEGSTCTPASLYINASNNQKIIVTVPCGLSSGSRFKDTITITYNNLETGIRGLTASGDIRGTVG